MLCLYLYRKCIRRKYYGFYIYQQTQYTCTEQLACCMHFYIASKNEKEKGGYVVHQV